MKTNDLYRAKILTAKYCPKKIGKLNGKEEILDFIKALMRRLTLLKRISVGLLATERRFQYRIRDGFRVGRELENQSQVFASTLITVIIYRIMRRSRIK